MEFKIINKLGTGTVGEAFLIEDGKVLIVGKRKDLFLTYKSLLEKSKLLYGILTDVKYPKVYDLICPCESFPYGAIIEDYIDGVELKNQSQQLNENQKMEIGKGLSRFLKNLHRVPFNGNKEKEIEINLAKYEKSLSLIKDYVSNDIYYKLTEAINTYKELMKNKEFVLTHGDLNASNIMLDNNYNLSGIIDFGNMEYYIPEIEFVHMYFFDKIIYQAIVDNYDKTINEKEVVLLGLIVYVRHFKNIVSLEEKRNSCLNNIEATLNLYLSM